MNLGDYEQGYHDGESSVNADWTAALNEVLPSTANFQESPTKVAEYIQHLQTLVSDLVTS